MARLGLDRRRLRHVPGLRFWRLLGTGAGSDTGPGADLRRTAMFAVWDDDAALEAFLIRTAPRIVAADESWHVRLRAAGGHGSWRGVDVLDHLVPAAQHHRPDRGDHPRRGASPFVAGVPSGGAAGQRRAAGRRRSAGGGGLRRDADRPAGHVQPVARPRCRAGLRPACPSIGEVIRRTRDEHWYGEELFARFEPYASSGRWDGVDPLRLATIGSSIP